MTTISTVILFACVCLMCVVNYRALKGWRESNKNFDKSAANFNELARINERILKINDDLIAREKRFQQVNK